jgi:hypothetical protein
VQLQGGTCRSLPMSFNREGALARLANGMALAQAFNLFSS